MKRRITAVLVLLCIAAAFVLPVAMAAGTVYFSVINNTVLPLNDATMPAYINGLMYLPYSFFSSQELDLYAQAGGDEAIIYASRTEKLTFNVKTGKVLDQDDYQYERYSAKLHNGIIYVPVQLICEFFGFTYGVTQTEPAAIVRVRTSSNAISDSWFAGLQTVKETLQAMYDVYIGKPPPSSSSTAPTTSPDVEQTYERVTVYLSFFELSGGKLESILKTLASTGYKASFFVTAEEIATYADLLRRAVCNGHTIGIWLKDGTYEEYAAASAYLFEAAQIRTAVVTALGDSIEDAEAMAVAESLVFWRPTRSYTAGDKFSAATLTGKLSTTGGARDSYYFACSDGTSAVLRTFLSYLSQYQYSVRRVTETSVAIEIV